MHEKNQLNMIYTSARNTDSVEYIYINQFLSCFRDIYFENREEMAVIFLADIKTKHLFL